MCQVKKNSRKKIIAFVPHQKTTKNYKFLQERNYDELRLNPEKPKNFVPDLTRVQEISTVKIDWVNVNYVTNGSRHATIWMDVISFMTPVSILEKKTGYERKPDFWTKEKLFSHVLRCTWIWRWSSMVQSWPSQSKYRHLRTFAAHLGLDPLGLKYVPKTTEEKMK